MQSKNARLLAVALITLFAASNTGCAVFNLNDPRAFGPSGAMGFNGDAETRRELAQQCSDLNSKRRIWSTIAAGSGIASGGGASGFLSLKEDALQDLSGGVAIAGAVIGVVAMYVSNDYTTDYTEKNCSNLAAR